MKPVFADTSFYIALVNPGDVHHADALAYMRSHRGRVTTTDYVLIEVGNWLSRTDDRPSFIALMRQLESDTELSVVPGSRELFVQGYELYKARTDKAWSLTDCISFVGVSGKALEPCREGIALSDGPERGLDRRSTFWTSGIHRSARLMRIRVARRAYDLCQGLPAPGTRAPKLPASPCGRGLG